MMLKKSIFKRAAVIALSTALVASSMSGSQSEAAKKTKLATKSLTLKVGKTKTIKLKNKKKSAKYTFKVKKAKIAKVDKKGKVTAKKVGKTYVTVTEKLKGKKKKIGKVTIIVKSNSSKKANENTSKTTAPTTTNSPSKNGATSTPATKATSTPDVKATNTPPANPTATSSVTTEPTSEPTEEPKKVIPESLYQSVDLSTVDVPAEVDEKTGAIEVKDKELFKVKLEKTIKKGEKIQVKVKGFIGEESPGFRAWLANGGNATLSPSEGLYISTKDSNVVPGKDFEASFELESTGDDAGYLLFKGIQYGTNIDALKLYSVSVVYPPSWEELDLSKFENGRCTYDETAKTLTAEDVAEFRIPLSNKVKNGKALVVNIKGKIPADSVGFRSWLVNSGNATLTPNPDGLFYSTKTPELVPGEDFDVVYYLESTGDDASCLNFKGIQYGTNIDNLVLTSVKVAYPEKIEKKPPIDPWTPENEQAIDTPLESLQLTECYAKHDDVFVKSPLITHDFIADPTTIEYDGRLYVYGTADKVEFDENGMPVDNAYNTHEIHCISSDDLVNWKDEGTIDVRKSTKWASNSWAPSIVSKKIGGKDKFFLYFANSGNGIGVLTADSPLGPWSDPIDGEIINRSVPNCSADKVPWCFDPGAFVDEDGTGYLTFGGGPETTTGPSNPKSARIVKLADDMVSLAEDPVEIDAPWFFEDNELTKINGKYVYSYCTNWDGKNPHGVATIGYMESDNPTSGYEFKGILFKNPGDLFGNKYNNHHHLFTFKGESYIIYHTTLLEQKSYKTTKGYRSLHIDKLESVKDDSGNITGYKAEPTWEGQKQLVNNDPYEKNIATFAYSGGIKTSFSKSQNHMVIDSINTGDWVKVSNADFASGSAAVAISYASTTDAGKVEIVVEKEGGALMSVASLDIAKTDSEDTYVTKTVDIKESLAGVTSYYVLFRGNGYKVADWQFLKDEKK